MSDTLTISHSVKVNLGNYESHDVFVSQTVDLDESLMSYEDVRDQIIERVRSEINEIYIKRKGKPLPESEMRKRYGI